MTDSVLILTLQGVVLGAVFVALAIVAWRGALWILRISWRYMAALEKETDDYWEKEYPE